MVTGSSMIPISYASISARGNTRAGKVSVGKSVMDESGVYDRLEKFSRIGRISFYIILAVTS